MSKSDFIPHNDSEFLVGHDRFKMAHRPNDKENNARRIAGQNVRTLSRRTRPFVVAIGVAVAVFGRGQICSGAGPAVYYSFNATNAIADIGSPISAFSYQNSSGAATGFVTGTTQNVLPTFQAGRAISQDHWLGDTNYFQVTLDATGLQDIVVSYAWERSGSGPTNAIFQYSLTGTGGAFVDFATDSVPTAFASAGSIVTQDLSVVAALQGDSAIAFRIVGINVGGASGAMHLDNLIIDAMAIPEPSALSLTGLGMMVLIARLVRRR